MNSIKKISAIKSNPNLTSKEYIQTELLYFVGRDNLLRMDAKHLRNLLTDVRYSVISCLVD
jgi:hypothetical protein